MKGFSVNYIPGSMGNSLKQNVYHWDRKKGEKNMTKNVNIIINSFLVSNISQG